MNGTFTEKDTKTINQSVRNKDRDWRFIKRILNSESDRLKRKLKIIELGSGTGSLAILANRTNLVKKYICVEGSKEMMRFIELEFLPIVKCVNKNVEEIKKFENCDLVISKYFFHHLKNKKETLLKIYESLGKEGKVIIIDKFPRWNFLSIIIEKILHYTRIKKILGVHYYTNINDFENIFDNKNCSFEILIKKVKRGKKLKNFHLMRIQYLLKKNK